MTRTPEHILHRHRVRYIERAEAAGRMVVCQACGRRYPRNAGARRDGYCSGTCCQMHGGRS